MAGKKRLEYYSSKLKGVKKNSFQSDLPSQHAVPTYIFYDRSVAVLEAVVEYLKEQQGLKYSEIARLLNRNDRTVWTVYSRAKKKRSEAQYDTTQVSEFIPLEIFYDRSVASLEAIVCFLKDVKGLKYSEIAQLLNRDDRTVWTVYSRAQKKREVKA